MIERVSSVVENFTMTVSDQRAKPLRVLVVEDEVLICMTLQDVLEDLGCEIAAVCTTLQEALVSSLSVEFDVAILDVNLQGEEITPVSVVLHDRDIPFIFSTGYGRGGVPQQFSQYPLIEKPFRDTDVKASLQSAMEGQWKLPPTVAA
jgi:CheY-like chemotaxis protein